MFIPVAENLQPFDLRAKELFNLNQSALERFLKDIESRGFKYIDLNPGPIRKDKEKIIRFFVEGINELSQLMFFIDSTDPEVFELVLKYSARKPIINSFSLERHKLINILPLAAKYDCDIVGLVMSDGFVPTSLEDKIIIAENMLIEAEKAGVKKNQIILDPIIAPLGWEEGLRSNHANLRFIKGMRDIFGEELRFMVGLSNLTTRAAYGTNKSYFQNIFISLLWQANIDFIMLDGFNNEVLKTVRFLSLLESGGVFSFAEFSS